MTAGSRRVSVNEDAPPLLVGGLPAPMKLLTAAFLRCSSSIARLFLYLINKNKPPISAAAATTPTTAPAAMAALFVPPDLAAPEPEVELEGPAVTMTVSPPTVTTDGFADVVDEGVDVALVDVADPDPDDTSAPMFVSVPML